MAREAAAEGIVLLKNTREVLPLQTDKVQSIAIIGPNAKTARIMAGGSAQVNAHYAITPFEAVVARAGEQIQIGYEQGCTNHKLLPLIDANLLTTGENERGLTVEYFNSSDFSHQPVASMLTDNSELFWLGLLPEGVDQQQFSVRATGRFTPEISGSYSFGLVSAGLSRLLLDGQEIIDNWTQQQPGEAFFRHGQHRGQRYRRANGGPDVYPATRIQQRQCADYGCTPGLSPATAHGRVRARSNPGGVLRISPWSSRDLSAEWESEGFDRPDLALVGEQNALIEAVAAANKNTIVILNTGSPIAMPWLDRVAAVVEAWYPGQECGNAIADVLFGDVNPSGKLTETFPLRLQDNPAYINYPGENGQVHYGEGIFVGYRYYEKKQLETLFPFGFGLSYTTFHYGRVESECARNWS